MMPVASGHDAEITSTLGRRVTRGNQPRRRVGAENPEVQGFASRMPSYGSRMRRSGGEGGEEEEGGGTVISHSSTRETHSLRGDDSFPSQPGN